DFNDAFAAYRELVAKYGEDPDKMGPEEFFGVWKTLCGSIVSIAVKIVTARDKAEKLKKREEAKQKREGGVAPKAASAAKLAVEGTTEAAGEGDAALATEDDKKDAPAPEEGASSAGTEEGEAGRGRGRGAGPRGAARGGRGAARGGRGGAA